MYLPRTGETHGGLQHNPGDACAAPPDSLDDRGHLDTDVTATCGVDSRRGQEQALAGVAEVGFRSTRE